MALETHHSRSLKGGIDHFDELAARIYPRMMPEDVAEQMVVDALDLSSCPAGGDILDAACGYGRHARALSDRGYRVVAVDRSGPLLNEARRRSGDASWPRWVQADCRDMSFDDATFDAVFSLAASIGYDGKEGDALTLSEFHRLLRPDGKLVIDTINRDEVVRNSPKQTWSEFDSGDLVLHAWTFETETSTLHGSETFVTSTGTRVSSRSAIRIYTPDELRELLLAAGFTEISLFGTLSRSPLTPRSRLVSVASRGSP